MSTWLAVGLAAYPVFLACVIAVLRAAKARGRAERAADLISIPGDARAAEGPVAAPASTTAEGAAPHPNPGDIPSARPRPPAVPDGQDAVPPPARTRG